MSFNGSIADETPVEIIFKVSEDVISEEQPMEEWSSLCLDIPDVNKKKMLYEQSLYDPGSGEICTKYIAVSASSVFRHVYYNYPAVRDPGVLKALLRPEPVIIHPDDGQELYMDICDKNNICPIKIFHKGLLEAEINLSYYGVNPNTVYSMAAALKYNNYVKILNLTDNFLNDDACFHLGEILASNSKLYELNLTGCRIGPSGVLRLLSKLPTNKTLMVLNLSKNKLGDAGVQYLADAIFHGLNIKQIYLGFNNITGKSGLALAEAFETHNKLTYIDLSMNSFFGPGFTPFFNKLAESSVLQGINLAWNSLSGPKVGTAIKGLLGIPSMQKINLSYNKLEGEAIKTIANNLKIAKKLDTLDLSYNPMSPADALYVLAKAKLVAVKVQNIYMENINVTPEFLENLLALKQIKSKKNTVVTYGNLVTKFVGVGPDPRELVLDRIEYLCKRNKHQQVDIALVVFELEKDHVNNMPFKDLVNVMRKYQVPVDTDLIEGLVDAFLGAKFGKVKLINIPVLADYIRRKWPDRKLPPTPPAEPEPEPTPLPKKKKK